MHTAAVHGLLETLALFITAISQVAKARLDAHGNKRPAQVLAMSQLVTAILDVVGITIHRIVRLSTKRLVDLRQDVRRTLTTVLTTQMAAEMVQRVTQLTAVVFVAMIAVPVLVLADRGLLVAQVLTIRIVVKERMLPETVPEYTAQPVAARHRAGVSTILLTATMSLAATGQQPSH
jgi:hypothetical protein